MGVVMIENGSEEDFKDGEDIEERAAADDAARLKKMPTHYVYVEAPDDAGRLMRVGCPSQKLNLGADHADLVPLRERGRADSMAG